MRSSWKGKFVSIDYNLAYNIDFDVYVYKGRGLFIKYIHDFGFFVYKGSKFEYIELDSLKEGFCVSSFIISKKFANIKKKNKILRKQRAQKLKMQKKE